MADFITPIVDIISRLWPCCAKHTGYLCKLEENKFLLSNAVEELKEARDDVQRRVVEAEADPNEPKKRTDPVRGWLERVEIIESEVEEILHKQDEQLNRRKCFGGCCPPNKCRSNYKLGKSVVEKMASVDELKAKGHFDEVTYRLPPPSVQEMNLESTVGMESMFDKVWKLITDKDHNVRIMGLYGKGGVGKTTLLGKINSEFKKINEHGHLVVFLVLSKLINYEVIQKKIGGRLGLSDLLQGDVDESSRADKIFNVLRNKNFVILLDDIWERVDLQRIGIPSPLTQCSSSKVIFTTRNKEVCGLMDATHKFQVECLPWDKAWSLFQDKVGEDALNSFPRARELAEIVAKECGGLPLALVTIGRAMSTRTSFQEWTDAITTLRKSASEFPGMGDEVLPRLKLSYDHLRNETIKACFLYCALYPEDHSIEMTRLIDYWIAEGFLNRFDSNLDEARSHGHHVIETLKRASLLEYSKPDHVKMHDIIRDLALWIVNGCKSSSSNNITTGKFLVAYNVCKSWRNAERIFWTNDGYCFKDESEKLPVLPNLQTLIVHFHDLFQLPQNLYLPLEFMPSLRVLDFSDSPLNELPTSICQLSELQYLGLMSTDIKKLPIELKKLVKLKFLDLSYTMSLGKIPPGVIASLSELQVLYLDGSCFMDWELKEEDGGLSFRELDCLKQLEDLRISIDKSLALENLLCNPKLRMICTGLTLQCCRYLKSVSLPTSAISKGLWYLTSLKILNIQMCPELEELILFIDDSGADGLLERLHHVVLSDLPKLNNIVWKEKYHHSSFQNLETIYIVHCDALKELTWLVYVENLKMLLVDSCEGLETIIELGAAAGGDQNLRGRAFGRLKNLALQYLPKLKSICRYALAFPSIETITIYECPELKKLPLDSGSNVNSTLQEITVTEEWWNELEWEDEFMESKLLPYLKKSTGWTITVGGKV